MMRIIPLIRAMSVPERRGSHRCAIPASSVRRGSTTISFVPRRTACFILMPMTGCASVVLDPMTKSRSSSRISFTEFVMAPLPNEVARPATVGACQVRAQ